MLHRPRSVHGGAEDAADEGWPSSSAKAWQLAAGMKPLTNTCSVTQVRLTISIGIAKHKQNISKSQSIQISDHDTYGTEVVRVAAKVQEVQGPVSLLLLPKVRHVHDAPIRLVVGLEREEIAQRLEARTPVRA